jgi:aspartyl aminopeptidase
MMVENNYVKLKAEAYGCPILNSWSDKSLSMAGRVSFKGENPINNEEPGSKTKQGADSLMKKYKIIN